MIFTVARQCSISCSIRILRLHSRRRFRFYEQRVCFLSSQPSSSSPDQTALDPNTASATTRDPSLTRVFTIPNALCLLRVAAAPVLVHQIANQQFAAACGVLTVAALSDLLDGWIARRFPSQRSLIGTGLDPLADKVLVVSLFLSLSHAGLLPSPLTALVLIRDLALFLAAAVVRWKGLEEPKTMRRYWNPVQPGAEIKPTTISKVNTAFQMFLLGVTIAAPLFDIDSHHSALQCLWAVSVVTTVTSGLSYMFSKNTYALMNKRT